MGMWIEGKMVNSDRDCEEGEGRLGWRKVAEEIDQRKKWVDVVGMCMRERGVNGDKC